MKESKSTPRALYIGFLPPRSADKGKGILKCFLFRNILK
jgi:hypothetical protein